MSIYLCFSRIIYNQYSIPKYLYLYYSYLFIYHNIYVLIFFLFMDLTFCFFGLYVLIKNVSSSISHEKTTGLRDSGILAFLISSTFVYQPILIKISMIANIMKTQLSLNGVIPQRSIKVIYDLFFAKIILAHSFMDRFR